MHVLKPKIRTNRLEKFQRQYRASPIENTKRETITIVLPCYKHSKFLPLALRSIKNQTRLPDEVILVNDNSPDDTSEVVQNFLDSNKHIKARFIINQTNIGQAASINKCVELATSDVIMIVNDDDYIFHNAVEVVMDYLAANPDVHLIGGSSVQVEHDNEIENGPKFIETPLIGIIKTSPLQVVRFKDMNSLNMTHSSSTFTKISWKTVEGYYPEKRNRVAPYSDRDFQLRIALCFGVAFTEKVPFAYWRINSSVDKFLNS